uniref:Nuclear transcription factor Y subunit gamma n=1 Tax=Zonotrichia albicollis TaxID=44394 RepID=A0A8D2MSS4_ZONAL
MSTDGGFGTGSSDAQQSLQSFWPRVMEEIRNLTVKDFRVQELPLARIKKIMKLDEDVKMISAEAPVLFAKAAQIFITELTLRAWIHTEDNKRRTLQRNDIAMAITKFDQFDFLIDIVPRDELKPPKRQVRNKNSEFFYFSQPDKKPNNTDLNVRFVLLFFKFPLVFQVLKFFNLMSLNSLILRV